MIARLFAVAGMTSLAIIAFGVAPVAAAAPTVVATGLNNPRGLAFDEEGNLYVAEGGAGGTTATTPGDCDQVVPPVGPYTGGMTARISRIAPGGTRTTVVDGLPSNQTSPASHGLVSGVADVAIVKGRLLALISGAGCSHGLLGTSNGIIRVKPDGATTMVADLSDFLEENPAANPDPGDFEPDGTWYSMVRLGAYLYAVNPNGQVIVRIGKDGEISPLVDFSEEFPGGTDWRGPTAITAHEGYLFVGTLTEFPIVVGKAQVFKVDPNDGSYTVFASGLTSILGLAFGNDGALYVLETSAAPGQPGPGQGRIVRIKGDNRTVIASGLNVPTAMAFGPDDDLYVSVNGYGAPPGAGQIVKISVEPLDEDAS